ncbi:hypothetical protein [Methylocaldum sp.]|uniref:hypothetical protein n=1 Tax=Methylocaldum sp. TaxID=1969727 RepID=UPI002D36DDD5|nr:hypothetical protein [Methylocaldum sp.]HYE36449.1 hypothetical protein [Methylocaldum sp.]
MLTLEKLKIYQQFNGDIDGWARSARPHDSSGMTDADWYLIDELLGSLHIIASGSASSQFAETVERKLRAAAADKSTREALRKLTQVKMRFETHRPLRFSRLWQGIGWLMVAIVIWLSLTPEPPQPPTPLLAWDKAQHMLAYAALMYWFRQAFLPRWRWPVFLVFLGVGLEFLQGLGGIRTFDPVDMAANSIGVCLGFGLSYTPLGKLLSKIDALVSPERL